MSEASSEPSWTIGRVLTWSVDFLRAKGLEDSPRLDAELLLGHALSLARIELYTQFDKPLTAAEREPFKAFLQRRSRGEPVAYITGEKEFMGLRFAVSPAVLIPRPDTELLVEMVLEAAKAQKRLAAPASPPRLRILDIGTGSGCIAASLAVKLAAAAEVDAWDNDEAALALARTNAASLGAEVSFATVDMLEEAAWAQCSKALDAAGRYDIIVSNPPYIAPSEAPTLAVSVASFEPSQALFASPDGLTFYRALAAYGRSCLTPGGVMHVEIGSTQAAAVQAIFAAAGWEKIAVRKDYARLDRVVSALSPA